MAKTLVEIQTDTSKIKAKVDNISKLIADVQAKATATAANTAAEELDKALLDLQETLNKLAKNPSTLRPNTPRLVYTSC